MKERDRESGRQREKERGRGEIMAFPDVVLLLSALALKKKFEH